MRAASRRETRILETLTLTMLHRSCKLFKFNTFQYWNRDINSWSKAKLLLGHRVFLLFDIKNLYN